MKALVKFGRRDGDVEIREVADPVAGPGLILVRAEYVGVCGSDLHMWRNTHSWECASTVVLGHEMSGTVAAVGQGVTGWSVGERVVCETAAAICGACSLCRTGRYNLCPHRQGYGAIRDGAFSEIVLAEPRVLHRIPEQVDSVHAAMTEPFAVAYNALVERATVNPGDFVVVQGIGAIGALAVQIARLRGAGAIVVLGTDNDLRRLPRALEMGADRVVNVSREDPRQSVAALGDGLGADLVVDATGVSAALDQALDLVRPLGAIVKVGWGPQPVGFSLDRLVQKAVSLHGSFSHSWQTWERVLGLFASRRLDPQAVLGATYPLEHWREAFEAMESGRNIKSVIRMAAR
jgi:alcohol dehydrogenase/L-iditol 2-dehydrogenase